MNIDPGHYIKNSYNAKARHYDNTIDIPFYRVLYDTYESELEKRRKHFSGRVLDAGCGTGIQSLWLSATAREVFGVDISEKLLEVADAKCRHLNHVNFLEADLTRLPFENTSFDAAVSLGETISHIADWQKAFSEIARVLMPGGIFMFSVLNKWNLAVLFNRKEWRQARRSAAGHIREWTGMDREKEALLRLKTFTPNEIRRALKNAGLELTYSRGIHISTLLVPLKSHRAGNDPWLIPVMEKLDNIFARQGLLSGLGYICLYVAIRK
ncbi:MAG: class I SAM-dependent methyltransferase [Bacteroidales bacterium]